MCVACFTQANLGYSCIHLLFGLCLILARLLFLIQRLVAGSTTVGSQLQRLVLAVTGTLRNATGYSTS